MQAVLFVVVLALASGVFVVGVAMLSVPAAFMVGAILAALIGWHALSDDGPAE